jgi:hypothetical protein
MNVHELFENYVTDIDGAACYFAGLPGYPRNFSRDTIYAGMIALDHHLLDNQLEMSSLHQGKKEDPVTGEEEGKIHHEYPGVIVHSPYVSTYNACDTTALYLIGLEMLQHLNRRESREFLGSHHPSIEKAISYIMRHTVEDMFWEYPPHGAKHFSLHTTTWKDSIVPSAQGKEEPVYPVSYALAQFQNARGMLAAGRLLDRQDMLDQADRMFTKGLSEYVREDAFCVERDRSGRLEQPSSDELHSLAFIPKEYAKLIPFDAIQERAKDLITPVGIACTPQNISDKLTDTYHGYKVWIFEQAIIHYGCTKFGLEDMAHATTGSTSYIETGHELLSVTPTIAPLGNSHQLWSVAAKIYFSDSPSLRQVDWL